MSKKNVTILVGILFFTLAVISMKFLTKEDNWLCVNNQWEKHGNPNNPPPTDIKCGVETNNSIVDFDSCVAAGNDILKTNPPQCIYEGKTFFEKVSQTNSQTSTENNNDLHEYYSARNVLIKLDGLYEEKQIDASPLVIKGEAPGTWFFEASFPVTLTDWDGRIIGQGIAQAEKDWMTTEMVPFTATINFETPSLYPRGSLILKKDNPSDLPEYDDYLEFSIQYKNINPEPNLD